MIGKTVDRICVLSLLNTSCFLCFILVSKFMCFSDVCVIISLDYFLSMLDCITNRCRCYSSLIMFDRLCD